MTGGSEYESVPEDAAPAPPLPPPLTIAAANAATASEDASATESGEGDVAPTRIQSSTTFSMPWRVSGRCRRRSRRTIDCVASPRQDTCSTVLVAASSSAAAPAAAAAAAAADVVAAAVEGAGPVLLASTLPRRMRAKRPPNRPVWGAAADSCFPPSCPAEPDAAAPDAGGERTPLAPDPAAEADGPIAGASTAGRVGD